MMIVENGFGAYDKKEADGTVDDQYRIDYLKEHIQAMKDAVEYDGVDLLGYTMWSPIDIVSASTGEYDKRYGFIYVNYNNNHEGDFSRSKRNHLIGINMLLKQTEKNYKNGDVLILFL